jgi:hypothetical protein
MVAARLRRPRHGERASSQKGCTGARSWANPMGIRFVAPAPSQTQATLAHRIERRANGEKRASSPSAALALLSSRQASVRFTVMPRIGFRLAPYSSHRCCRPLSDQFARA